MYKYFLHRYGDDPHPFATFTSRKALSACMKALPYSPLELADKFFLHVMAPRYSAVYDFNTLDNIHLSAVLSRKIVFRSVLDD